MRMWAVLEALSFLPELIGGTPTPMPSIATRWGETGPGQGPACAPSPPRAVDATPLPAIRPVAEPLPLSSWPVTGGPCFSGTSGCGATSEEAGKYQCSRWLSFPPVLHNLKPHPQPGLTIHPSLSSQAEPALCPPPRHHVCLYLLLPAPPTSCPLLFSLPVSGLVTGSPRPWAEESVLLGCPVYPMCGSLSWLQ